jgi:hypothetical protein
MKLLLCFLADTIIPYSPLQLAACIFYIYILPCVSCYCFGAIFNIFLFVYIGSWFLSLIVASCFQIKTTKLIKKNEAREREKEIRPGERERGGGAPEREGGAARGGVRRRSWLRRWEQGDFAAAGEDNLVGFGDGGRRWFWFVFSFVPLFRSFVWYIGFDLGMVTYGGL